MPARPRGILLERHRRRSEVVIAAILLPIPVAFLILVLVAFAPHDSVRDRYGAVTVGYVGLALSLVLGLGPRMDVTGVGLRVVNWVWVYSVPWSMVREVRVTHCLVIDTVDGAVIRPTVGSASVGSRVQGLRLQRRLAEAIRVAKAGSDTPAGVGDRVVRRLNGAVTAAVAGYLVLMVCVTVFY
jgi:hypothetical protein